MKVVFFKRSFVTRAVHIPNTMCVWATAGVEARSVCNKFGSGVTPIAFCSHVKCRAARVQPRRSARLAGAGGATGEEVPHIHGGVRGHGTTLTVGTDGMEPRDYAVCQRSQGGQ
jgi:hypothetical protein